MDKTESFFDQIRAVNLEAVSDFLKGDPGLLEGLDQRGSTPLVLAAYYGHGDLVALLLEIGSQVEIAGGGGNMAVMGVCFKGFDVTAELLIATGANVNHMNSMWATCLLYAVSFNGQAM